MDERDVRSAITPLRMVFWGGLLCVLDFNLSIASGGSGFQLDLLNDIPGAWLIAVGVSRLARAPVGGGYAGEMAFVKAMAILAVPKAFLDHFILTLPAPAQIILLLFTIVTLCAVVVFCTAMSRFCAEAGLESAERSWKLTRLLFILITLLPIGAMHLISIAALTTGESFRYDLGPAALLVVPIFLIPIIHLFVSTSRMKDAAGAMRVGAY